MKLLSAIAAAALLAALPAAAQTPPPKPTNARCEAKSPSTIGVQWDKSSDRGVVSVGADTDVTLRLSHGWEAIAAIQIGRRAVGPRSCSR